ncbi:hypothetical protein D9Q98_005520 [Chlorella vulgaris]|uniref:Vps41 beta-propeller domain-containing protein n=1 Tax=Chlorella vulgaris TaxID=3077 RepID=A0A9D4YW06_CHLVU|nr:hypothetical protein D9Q98_005520 [Chlorella vulgaris]
MPSSHDAIPEVPSASPAGPGEEEPRLRYGSLDADAPYRPSQSTTTRLCVSDKVLAVGHRDGTVELLDHLGNQVKAFTEHTREVTDLSFDATSEYLASSSADGSLALHGLYSDEVQRVKVAAPVTAVALDPRYGARKTRELVYGTAGGSLILSSKGWLGNKETPLFTGRGAVHCARMSGTLLAWATDSGLRVYDTASHTRLGKVERPSAAADDPAAPCSLLWRSERELFVAWGRHVSVLRVVGSLLPGERGEAAPGRSLHIVASFDAGCTALGAAPFGADLAVLTWGVPADSLPTSNAAGDIIIDPSSSQPAAAPAAAVTGADSSSAAEASAGLESAAEGSAIDVVDEATVAEGSSIDVVDEAKAAAGAADRAADGAAAGSAELGNGSESVSMAVGDGLAQQPQQQPSPSQPPQQHLSLCFYSRAGHLLAVDALGCSCSQAERRWHQLAFTYPGDADLKLGAAVPPVLQQGSRPSASPTPAASAGSSRRSSAAGSVRSSPAKGRQPPAESASAALHAPNGEARGEVASSAAAVLPSKGLEALDVPAGGGLHHSQQQQSQQQQQQQHEGKAVQMKQYKWWRDGEEPSYFICTPSDIIVGRPRDGNDRVAWLGDRGRYAEALSVAEEDRSVTAKVRESLGEQYLQALVADGRYQEAAALSPRVLRGSPMAWERWAFTFAQLRQLAALAPHLPTESPRLKPSTYDLVLSSFLLHPSDHELLLQLVQSWPPELYDTSRLQSAILRRMGGGGSWPVLQQAAAHLYTQQGRYEEALRIMLQLRSKAVFEYISHHALVDRVSAFAAELVDLDEVRGTSLLVEHCEEVAPSEVVAALQDAVAAAPGAEGRQRWRRRLHHYLDWLFQRDSQLGAAFSELQVELYAEFEPGRLLHFLMVSPSYPLERAYQVCEQRGLMREMVFVLGRMGSSEKALRLIVEGLRDVVQAVEFVQLQRDDELWEQLIALTLGDAQLTGALLDHAGGYIDPLRVVSQIPAHLRVDNLRGRLVKIITDFRTQMSLQQGCNTILRHDCVVLSNRLYRVLRASLRRLHLKMQNSGGSRWVLYDSLSGEETAEDDTAEALLAGLGAEARGEAAAARTPSPSPAGGSSGGGGTPGSAGRAQQAQQRVWVGFLGGPPAAEADSRYAAQQQQQQQGTRSPSKFVRLASSSPAPARSGGLAPRKIALAS